MSVVRQKILVLWTAVPEPSSQVCAWSQYDGTGETAHQSGDGEVPPYETVLAAMMDGWRVLQWPAPIPAVPGAEHRTGLLKFEFVLERLVDSGPRGK
jgi:hypothetical protein